MRLKIRNPFARTPTPPTIASDRNSTKNSIASYSASAALWDDNKDVDRIRFTLENVLDRYGRHKNVRANLFTYSYILFAAQFFIIFWKTRLEISQYDQTSMAENRGSPLCCCSPSYRLKGLEQGLREMFLDSPDVDFWYMIAFVVTALISPLWERFGRRRMILLSFPISSLSLVILTLIWEQHVIKGIIFIQSVAYSLIHTASVVTVLEMLPRDGRVFGIIALQTARTHPLVFTSIFILYPSISSTFVINLIALLNIVAFFLCYRFASDSLCHMVVNSRISETDKRVMREEISLARDKDGTNIDQSSWSHLSSSGRCSLRGLREEASEEGDSGDQVDSFSPDTDSMDAKDFHYFEKVVQLVTDDLAFDEDDTYTKREFMSRLFKSNRFYRLIYAFFAMLLAGLIDGLCQVYLKEIDLEGSVIIAHKIIAKVGSAVGICAIRKWSRMRAAKTMMILIVINIALRGAMAQFDGHHCSNSAMQSERMIGSGILAASIYLFNDVFIYAILLCVVENSPCLMRIPTAAVYIICMGSLKGVVKSTFGPIPEIYRTSFVCVLLFILIIIAVVFRKILDEDCFSVFLKDLVKDRSKSGSNEKAPGSDDTMREKQENRNKAKTPTVTK